MRTKIVAGNWKMHMDMRSGADLIEQIKRNLNGTTGVQIILCPPFVLLDMAGALIKGTLIALGGQNMHQEPEGAFTGEISTSMLLSAGCSYVIVGHSERRQLFGETDAMINRKAGAAIASGLTPIICIGETLSEREAGRTMDVISTQVRGVLESFDSGMGQRSILAYEPVWAIGTGKTATPEQAQEVHAFIRTMLQEKFEGAGAKIPLLYGGSVKPENAESLFSQPDIDGGLIGGASLKASDFTAIAVAAARSVRGNSPS